MLTSRRPLRAPPLHLPLSTSQALQQALRRRWLLATGSPRGRMPIVRTGGWRMRRWLSVLALLFVGFGFENPALADKRVALIVANGDYKGAALENPATDADLIEASLRNIGFSVKVVKNADLD